MPAFLVTGASTGIGEACALRLHGAGHTVYAGVRRPADGERLRDATSERLRPVALDVTDEAQVRAAAADVSASLGRTRFGGVVNNAGIALGGPAEYLPLDDWRRQLEVNVVGQVAVTQAFLPLVRDGCGRIVFVGSIGGRVASPMLGPYSASKFALESVADTFRMELHDWGIEVSMVEPGGVATPIWDKARSLSADLRQRLPAEALERYAGFVALIEQAIEFQATNGVAPSVVAGAVEHALTADRPRTRYVVGRDAKAQAIAARLLPDRWLDAAQRAVGAKLRAGASS